MSNEELKKELREAEAAGERALKSLGAAKEKLDSARKWGIADMAGGGMLSGLIKHSKMDAASELMEQAKHDLKDFQRELKDVQISSNLQMNINSFLSFADIFFDGLAADWLVQSKIADARRQVDDAIRHVRQISEDLKRQINML